MNVTTVGLDIAKSVFYAHGVDRHGKVVMQRKLTRSKVLAFFAKLPLCLIGIEATGSAHYWARELMKFGHTVKLMPAQYVKPYVKRDKSDPNDAAGICEAVSRPSMRFAAINTVEQQDMQMLHAIRQRLMQQRTAALNQIRGLLAEYGIVFNQGANYLRRGITELLSREAHGLSGMAVELIQDVQEQLTALDERLAAYDAQGRASVARGRKPGATDARVKRACQSDPRCQEIEALPGIGPLTATALVAKVGDGKQFKRARQMGSCLGLTAREHSSGGKQRQYGISKRGDTYVRTLLIHGARSVLRHAAKKTDPDPLLRWALGVQARRGANIAAVALANKLARIAWAILAKEHHYDPHWVPRAA